MIHIETLPNSQYHKRIVFDIDDTISFTTSRDWENATPNQPLITKINKLFYDGWEIYLVTARGNISCKSREEAFEKYGDILIKWLKQHGVKYHVLSFQKELATYYVDDKGITPEDFLNLNIKTIKKGWSGATIELRDDKIYKTHPNSKDVAKWYNIAKNYISVPKVHSLIGDTLCLEYINNNSDWKVEDIGEVIKTFKSMPDFSADSSFKNYVDRVDFRHVNNVNNSQWDLLPTWVYIKQVLSCSMFSQQTESYMEFISDPGFNTFCHGDFSIDNILCNNGKIYMIDPIYEPDNKTWNSWLLDASKLLMSLKKNGMDYQYNDFRNRFAKSLFTFIHTQPHTDALIVLDVLEILQWIRILKYAPSYNEKESIFKNIKLLEESIQNIFKNGN